MVFFQYYLGKGHLYISTYDHLPEWMSFSELTTRVEDGGLADTDGPGASWSTLNINTQDPDADKYLVLALNINQTSYNKLHDRVLEVSYGFYFNTH